MIPRRPAILLAALGIVAASGGWVGHWLSHAGAGETAILLVRAVATLGETAAARVAP